MAVRYAVQCKKCKREMNGIKSKCIREYCHSCHGKNQPRKPYFMVLIVHKKEPAKILKDGAA